MAGLLSRIYNLARANLPDPDDLLQRFRKSGPDDAFESDDGEPDADDGFDAAPPFGGAGAPRQVAEDLATFNLAPPSSLDAVRRARNREIRKYHSDRFMNDPEKFETSKQIMQIYNAAYDRLEEYYKTRGDG